MTRRTFGALCGLSLLAITPSLAMARQAPPAAQARSSRDQALDALRARTEKAGQGLRVYEGPFGTPRYLTGVLSGPKAAGVSYEAQARAFLASQSALFPVEGRELVLSRTVEDRVGGQHLKFEQFHQGVPVFGATLVVHMDKSGVVEGLNGTAVGNLSLNVSPELAADDVYELVDHWLLENIIDLADARLVVYPMRSGNRLAYQLAATLENGPRILFVDANSGELIWSENPLRETQATGTGIDVLGKPVTNLQIQKGKIFPTDVTALFNVYIQSAKKGAFNMVDLTTKDQGYIYTFTSHQTYLMNIDYVSSPDNSFDDLSTHDDASGVSAHTFYRQTLNFYKNLYNRNGIDGKGLNISAVVEVNGTPNEALECNAGWLGYGYDFMIFGMGGDCGSYGKMYPFSAGLDVIGHELTHGVTEFTTNLGYDHEAGALNESMSDVFGVLDEAYNGNPNWLIGEALAITPVYPYDAFRSFVDPTLYSQPATMANFYTAPMSYDAGGVHYNSGITNHAFYLAVVGGTFNGVTVTPLDPDLATSRKIGGEIWYDVSNSMRISAKSQFNDFRDALIAAANKLYPSKVATLQQAFQASGVVDDIYPTAAQDKTEPNDYPATAPTIAVGGTATSLIWDRNDTDMYALALNAGQSVKITLSKLAFEAQLNLYSVGPYSTLKNEAVSDNAGTADESFTFSPKTGGTFYIEVGPNKNRGSRTAPYTLTVAKN